MGIALEVQKIRTKRQELMLATMDMAPDLLDEEIPVDDEDSVPNSVTSPDTSLRGRSADPLLSPASRQSMEFTRADLDLRKVTSVSVPLPSLTRFILHGLEIPHTDLGIDSFSTALKYPALTSESADQMQEELEDLLASRPEIQVDGGLDSSQHSGGRYSGVFGPMGVRSSVPTMFRTSPDGSNDSLIDHSAPVRDRRNPNSPIRGLQRPETSTSMFRIGDSVSPLRSLLSPPRSVNAMDTAGYGSAKNFLDDADDAGEVLSSGPEDGSQSPMLKPVQPPGK